MRVFNIDITRKGISPVVQVTEYDAMSRFFTLVLRNGSSDYEPPENPNYSVWYKTKDSTGWYDTITLPDESTRPAVVADGNAFTIEIAEQATTSCGELALMINGDDGYQLTVSGIITQSADIPGYDGEEVENYYNVFITRMQENAARAENAAATAIEYGATVEVDETAQQLIITHTDNTEDVQTWVTEAEAWAVGQRDGVDVPSTDETYHNNAKYYAGQYNVLNEKVTELENELNLSPTKNLIDVFTPDAVNSAAVSMTDDGDAKITALSNLTYLAAFYLIDTRDINKLTISYGSYAGTGSGNIRVGYVATPEDLPSSITWISYLNNTNPKTYTVSAYDYIVIALYAVQAANPGAGNFMIYNHVQVEAGIVATEYTPHFVPTDSIARDDIADINNTLVEIADNISSINAAVYNPVSAVYAPDGYRWTDNPLNGKITEDFKNNVTVDYDISQHDPTTDAGTYYVDPIRGLSSNDGKTWETAFGNIATALQQSDVTCIMLREGFYNATKNLYNTVISKTVAIKGEPGKNVYLIQASATQMTEDEDHPGVYSGSRGNCYGVIDLAITNFDNDPMQYVNAASVADVYSTPGSWILTDGVLYVHTVDNRIPDADLILFRSGDNLHAIGDITLYLENLKVYGGNSPLWVENSSTIGGLRVFAKDCDFYYSYTADNDAVMLQGAELSIFKNCRAKYAQKDGFNYHAKNSVIPHAIEINCTGAYNGNIEDSNDQGSTIHDAGSIIRINGLYHDNYGGNLADQGANTEAWMINCVAYKSISPNSGQNANFFTYDDVKYWLDSCIGFASVSNVYRHNDGAQVNLRNCRFEGKLAPAGQEVTYY